MSLHTEVRVRLIKSLDVFTTLAEEVKQGRFREDLYYAQDQLDKGMADLKAQLEKVAITAHAAGAVQVDSLVVNGYPASKIVRRAREQSCGLIVMGTHGRTGIKHVLIGSVAENVVRTAECPVLTLRAATKKA